ncbi:elongator complex protein 3 [Syntrophotalea acetylenica]|nr:radical SAM protein [Syntrophotalea acetylenica]
MVVFPFFIPHCGCAQRCVFCQQNRITSVETAPSPAEVARCLEVMLPERGVGEVAFYGGSFTMLDPCLQEAYLAGVVPFVRAGRVAGIRVSTRPDGCDNERVARLRAFNVTTVELGCQSFSDAVLRKARRGHDASAAGESVMRLRNAGLRVGLQLMPGLPGGDGDEARRSLARALDLEPDFLRLYPAVVLAGTGLAQAWRRGDYVPLDLDDAVELCAELLWHCHDQGVPVIRLGLQSSPELDRGSTVLAGPYHPAFGQLVRSRLWRRALESTATASGGRRAKVDFADLSDAMGHRRTNLDYLSRRFGHFEIVSSGHQVRQCFVLAGCRHDMMSQARYLQPLPPTTDDHS